MKKITAFFLLLLTNSIAFAQDADNGMAFDLRSSGKIYVVVAVITVVFIGLAIYLFSIDRRIKKLEK